MKKGNILKEYIILAVIVIATVGIFLIYPQKSALFEKNFFNYLVQMLEIFPAVMILSGLLKIFVSKDIVGKYLGKTSGFRGLIIAVLLGTLPEGPLYIAFPLVKELREKGAKVSNLIIFMSAWACIKIPQELVELQFLGLKFMALRLTLTIIFVIIMGLFAEKIYEGAAKSTVQ
jgi:uncharacterized membrane protein YraQ (UPF0718 family)